MGNPKPGNKSKTPAFSMPKHNTAKHNVTPSKPIHDTGHNISSGKPALQNMGNCKQK